MKPSIRVLVAIMLPALFLAACNVVPTATPTPAPTVTLRVQYKEAFPMTIDPNKQYLATLRTEKGDIVIELNAKKAPKTVNNFVSLSQRGFYDNTTFHRVLTGFMAQGGDPTGTGGGGPGYTIPDEPSDLRHERGVISMANTGRPNSGGSQWFITYVPTPHLDSLNPDGTPKACGTPGVSCHTVFGKVVSGMDVADKLTPRDPSQNPRTPGDKLVKVTIEEK